MGGIRLSWILDVALMLKRAENPQELVDAVVNLNKKRKKDIMKLFGMASLLLPQNERFLEIDENELTEEVRYLMLDREMIKKHRFINLNEILHTGGVKTKLMLLWREIFPEEEYMRHRYSKEGKLWRLYLKRIFKI